MVCGGSSWIVLKREVGLLDLPDLIQKARNDPGRAQRQEGEVQVLLRIAGLAKVHANDIVFAGLPTQQHDLPREQEGLAIDGDGVWLHQVQAFKADPAAKVLGLAVDQVDQHGMLEVPEDVASCPFDLAVLPLRDEAAQTSPDRQHAIMQM
jgi:hypothetical protein